MLQTKLTAGTVHRDMPADLQSALRKKPTAQALWQTITPLARNEWICLVTSAKQVETRQRRITRTVSQLSVGQRRPCCWQGCPHRAKGSK